MYRILPLYFLTLFFITMIVAYQTGWELHEPFLTAVNDMVKWLLFHGQTINGFAETRTIIAGVDWSLKYEWLFYICLPIAAALFRKSATLTFLALATLSICALIFPIEVGQFKSKFLFCFFAGGVAAYATRNMTLRFFITKRPILWSVINLILVITSLFFCAAYSAWQMLTASIIFLLIVSGVDFFGLLRTKAMLLLGEISFSVYLLHALLLYLVFTVFTVIDLKTISYQHYLLMLPFFMLFVFLVSLITFKWIEQPSILKGKKIQRV